MLLACGRLRSMSKLILLSVALLTAGSLFLPARVSAQSASDQTIDPKVFGLDIPAGPRRAGAGRRVVTTDEAGRSVVGKIHLEVGDQRIVLLPDGQLVVRPASQSPVTERPFKAAEMDALAAELTESTFKGFKTKQTNHYLYIYNTSDGFALAASRILETMFPGVNGYAKAQKIEVHDPEVPLVVIMFRTEDEFQKFRRMPDGVVAYYNILDNRVVMYEESQLYKVKPEMGLQQSISTIAHEGAHQILHNIGVQQRLSMWPMWLAEGFAEFFAPTIPGRGLRWKGAGQVNDLRMFELENYIKARSADTSDGQMIIDTVSAARLSSTGYAAAWSLTHFLAKTRRNEFHAYVNEVSKLGPLEGSYRVVAPGIVPDNKALFAKHFGADNSELERRLVLHLQRLPYKAPFADYPHYVGMIAAMDGRKAVREANVFINQALAERWQRETISRLPEASRESARGSIRLFQNRPLAEQYAAQWLRGR